MNWYTPAEHSPDQRLSGAPEIYAQLSALDEGDEAEYVNQLKYALLRGDSAKQVLRHQMAFMFCSSALTRQFTSNYPASFVEPHCGAVSMISCIKSEMDVPDILKAMVHTGVD